MKRTEVQFNPIFKKHLMTSLKGKEIVDMVKYDFAKNNNMILKKQKIEEMGKSFCFKGNGISLLFDDGFVVDMNAFFFLFGLTHRFPHMKSKKVGMLRGGIFGNLNCNVNLLSTSGHQKLKAILGKKIVSTYLLWELDWMYPYSGYHYYRSPSFIGGIGIELDNGENINFCKGGAGVFERFEAGDFDIKKNSSDIISKKLKNLKMRRNLRIDLEDKMTRSGFYKKTNEFVDFNKEYHFMFERNLTPYILSAPLFDNVLMLDFSEVREDNLLKIPNILTPSNKETFFTEVRDIAKIEPKNAKELFQNLLEELHIRNVGIANLYIGRNSRKEFGLIKPIDIVPIYECRDQHEIIKSIILEIN